MSKSIFPLRLSRRDRQIFGQAARAEQKSLAEWLRAAGSQRARQAKQRAACLGYPDQVVLSREAERDPKSFIRSKLKARYAVHR
jgi:hypothetical protein